MVRRLKEDIRATQGGLPERRVERVVIDGLSPDAPELELSRLLDECRTAREERHAHTSNKAQAAAGLLVVGLQQRLLSSVEAFAGSLAVHRRTVERHWEQGQADNAAGKEPDPPAGTGQASEQESPAPANDETHHLFLTPPAADDERGEQEADLIEAEEEVQIEAITVAAESSSTSDHGKEHAELWRQEQQLLDRMQAIAERARHQPDSKTRRLIDWIREHMCPTLPPFGSQPAGLPTRWNDRRVLIFTEDREGTKRYLKATGEPERTRLGRRPWTRSGRRARATRSWPTGAGWTAVSLRPPRGAASQGDRPIGRSVDRTSAAEWTAEGLRARSPDANARPAGTVPDRSARRKFRGRSRINHC